jgi:hypothetical protein
MKLRMLLSSLFKIRNISVLIILLSITFSLNPVFSVMNLGVRVIPETAVSLCVALYLGFVIQSLTSRNFHDDLNKKEKIRNIRRLNNACFKLANEAKKYTNSTYLQKLRKVMFDKDEVVKSFIKGEKGLIKEKIVEQTMNLVIAYNKLLINFCIRNRELKAIDVNEVTNRINTNLRKLNFTNDANVSQEIKSIIEMDERMLQRHKDEKKELERINTKLNYMESSVSMFKHLIFSNIESEEMDEKLETVVNEANALSSVLEERRRSKTRYF